MTHDFKAFPELTNSQLDFYYFESPHKQIFEDFTATVTKVHDADTITVKWADRLFEFPIRISNVSARELSETDRRDTSNQMTMPGKQARDWLSSKILGEEVTIEINPANRVEKFGRLLGRVIYNGVDIGLEAIVMNAATSWENRADGRIRDNIPKQKRW